MSKKKKRNRAEATPARGASAQSEGVLQPTLVDEVLQCTNGADKAREHLSKRPEMLFFATSAVFQTFQVADLMGEGFEMPSNEVLDYLEFGSRALGMTDVAGMVKKNFPASIMLFDETIRGMDGEAIGRAINNAKAMGFLLA